MEHLGTLGVDHLAPDPRIELGRGLLVLRRGELLPGRERALVEAGPDLLGDAVMVVVVQLVELGEARRGGLLQEGGASQRVLGRVGLPTTAQDAPGTGALRPM